MTRLTAAVLAAALALGAAPAASAATTLNAAWTDACGAGSNCFTGGAFTQAFSASDFDGPVTVGRLLLDRSILGDLVGKTFRLSFVLNGEELGSWGSFTMAGIGGDQFAMGGSAFTWNPQDGDLVLVLEILGVRDPGALAGGGGFAGLAAPNEDGPGGGGDDPPLLPDFVTDPDGDQGGDQGGDRFTSPAPEPSAWALMIIGFGGTGALLRLRRRKTFAAA